MGGGTTPAQAFDQTVAASALLNATPVPALIVANGRITWCNRAAALTIDRPASLITGTPISDLVAPSGQARIEQGLQQSSGVIPGEAIRVSTALVRRDRPPVDVEFQIAPLDEHSHVVQLVQAAEPQGATLAQQRMFRSTLLELSQLSHEHMEEADFYDVFIHRAIDAVPGAQCGSILVRRPGTDEFHFAAAKGFDLAGLQTRCLMAEIMFRDIDLPEAAITREFSTEGLDADTAEWLTSVGRIHDIMTNVSAPVFANGEAVAFVSLDNFEDREAFDETSIEMTTVLGRLIADLIQRRRLEAELRLERESFKHLAHHDGLTGLANRRHIEDQIADAVINSNRTREPMAVLFIDLDDFKTVNDSHGHDVGDRLLVAVADTLKLATRPCDIVGRWGGDEFVILAHDVPTRRDAIRLAHSVLEMFGTELQLDQGRPISCGLSIGVSWTQDAAEGFHTILRRADDALYAAKSAGKHTVRANAA